MDTLQVYRITSQGQPRCLGAMARAGNGFRLEATRELPRWLRGVEGNGEFPDLPFFIEDLRPQGFLGKIRVGEDPDRLGAVQILDYIARAGTDLPGDLIVGEDALNQAMQKRAPVSIEPSAFDTLADQLSAGAGASCAGLVGGAQPKFCAHTECGPVIVKFAPVSNQRKCDLLVAEHLALTTLAEGGIPAAKTRLHHTERFVHLEVVRFDRVGERGRRPAVSLRAVDLEYAGVGHGWPAIMYTLHQQGWVSEVEVELSKLLNLYGMLIENTDRHAGNLSLIPHGTGRLAVAPAYDMLPMRYAFFDRDLTHPPALQIPADENEPAWAQAVELAYTFWSRVQADERISGAFRALAGVRAGELDPRSRPAPGPG